MTFAEWEASRKGGVAPTAEAAVDGGHLHPTAEGFGNSDVDRLLAEAKGTLAKSDVLSKSLGSGERPQAGPAPDRSLLSSQPYQASELDSPAMAAGNELSRTGARALVGLAKSPVDALKGMLGIPAAIKDTVETAVSNPRGFASAIPDALKSLATVPAKAIMDPTTDPTEAASLGGQIMFGEGAPGLAKGAVRAIPEVAGPAMRGLGKAVNATGKGAEALGASKLAKTASQFGPLEAALHMDPMGIAAAAAPAMLRGGGKLLQRAGQAVTDAAPLKGLRSVIDRFLPAAAEEAPSAAETMKGKVSEARGYEDTGFSHQMAGKLADVPVGEEKPFASKQTAKKVTFPADVKAEQADLQDQGFGEGAVDKLTKGDQKAASGWTRNVLGQRLQMLAEKLRKNPVGYSFDEVTSPQVMTREQQYAGAKKAKISGTRTSALDGLRAVLNSMDDATTFGRGVRSGGRSQ